MKFNFTKMHGCGNDFMIIDCRDQNIILTTEQIVNLADYKKSVGFDQLLLIRDSAIANVTMQIFNNDGKEAAACGNGSRCVAKLILADQPSVTIATADRVLTAHWQNELVAINMGQATIIEEDLQFSCSKGSLVDIGNQHIILNDADNFDILKYGPLIENDQRFPNKVNVNFVKVINKNLVNLRVWERGSGATLACGTGACASFFLLYKQGLINKKALIRQFGGDLEISLNEKQDILMAGEAEISYQGAVKL